MHGQRPPDGGARAPSRPRRQLTGEIAALAALAILLLVALLILLPFG